MPFHDHTTNQMSRSRTARKRINMRLPLKSRTLSKSLSIRISALCSNDPVTTTKIYQTIISLADLLFYYGYWTIIFIKPTIANVQAKFLCVFQDYLSLFDYLSVREIKDSTFLTPVLLLISYFFNFFYLSLLYRASMLTQFLLSDNLTYWLTLHIKLCQFNIMVTVSGLLHL